MTKKRITELDLIAAREEALEEAAKACEAHEVEPQVMIVISIDDTERSVACRECAATIRFLKARPE